MGRRGRRGETQRERRTRVKNQNAPSVYNAPSSHKLPKDLARALRRHPPTTCVRCGIYLVWHAIFARYSDPEDTSIQCVNREEHVLANGKRPNRFAGGDQLTI